MNPRRRPSLALLAVCVGSAVSVATATEPSAYLQPKVLETFFRMRVVAALLDTQSIDVPFPGPTSGLVPASWLRTQLRPVPGISVGSLQDAWGNALLYWSDGRDYLVLSLGADGKPQFDYAAEPPYANVTKGWAGSDPRDDLIIVDGVAYRGPASQRELLRRAMADMRSAGTACESFAIDNNFYPGPVTPIDIIDRIARDVEPIYIVHLPKVDPWGHPYLVWSDTRGYALVSYGPDGQADYPYATWSSAEFNALHTGPTMRTGQDIVFANGQFVQWPAIMDGP